MSENKCNEVRTEVFESWRKNRAKFSEVVKKLLVDSSECKQREHEAPLMHRHLKQKLKLIGQLGRKKFQYVVIIRLTWFVR